MDGDFRAAPIGVIEIRIRECAQLFNSLDPSPFHERDLDPRAEAYIVSWAREYPADSALKIVVYLPEQEARAAEESGLDAGLRNYFGEEAAALRRELKELFRMGRAYLSIGLPILLLCFLASQLVRTSLDAGPIAGALEESLIILGWVANWKPIETYLYDWWPLWRRRNLYLRLSRAEVVLKAC
jgi:hypothetical protein